MKRERRPIDIRSRSGGASRELPVAALERVVRTGRSVLVLTDLDLMIRRVGLPGVPDTSPEKQSLTGGSILPLFHQSEHEFLSALLDRCRGAGQFDVANILVRSASEGAPPLHLSLSTIVGASPEHALVTWRLSNDEQPPLFDDVEDIRSTLLRRIKALQARLDVHRQASSNARRALGAAMDSNRSLSSALRSSRKLRDQHITTLQEANQAQEIMHERLRQAWESEAEARRVAEKGRQTLGFLADASRELSESLDFTTTLQRIAGLAIPMLGNCCIVDLVESETGELRHAHAACVNPDMTARLHRYSEHLLSRSSDSEHLRRVVASGRSFVMHRDGEAFDAPAADSGFFLLDGEEFGFRSCLIAALRSRDRVFGTMTFVSADPLWRYEPEDLDIAEDIALRSAQALDNAMLYQAAEEASKVREQYLAMASHELRSPLTVVSGFGALLLRALNDPEPNAERIRELGRELQHGVERLEMLTDGLLASSSFGGPTSEPHFDRIDLVAHVRELIDRLYVFDDELRERRISFDAPASLTGLWDAEALERALTNVLSNALKYSPETALVQVTIRQVRNMAEIRVQDHGIGMSEDELRELFSPFVRGRAARQHAAGSGLGLYITKLIVDRHHGEIRVESEPDVGSIVTIRLPLSPPISPLGSQPLPTQGESEVRALEAGSSDVS